MEKNTFNLFIICFSFIAVTHVKAIGTCPGEASICLEGTSRTLNGDLFGVNAQFNDNSQFECVFSGTPTNDEAEARCDVILNELHPSNFRYPGGTYGMYFQVDPTAEDDPDDKVMDSCDTTKNSGDCIEKLDSNKLAKNKIPGDFEINTQNRPLSEIIALATEADPVMSVTLDCNLVTPGGDYFEQDVDYVYTVTELNIPLDVSSIVVSTDYPFYADSWDKDTIGSIADGSWDINDTGDDDHAWWKHMAKRAQACLDMLDKAYDNGLPLDKMYVELGQEFWLVSDEDSSIGQDHQYIAEVFPSYNGTTYE